MPRKSLPDRSRLRGEPGQQGAPIPRLVAIAATLMTLTLGLLLAGGLAVLNWMPAEVENPLVPLLLAAGLMAGTLIALIGLIAGIADLVQSQNNRRPSLFAVTVNGLFCAVVLSLIVGTLINAAIQ